jgi:hypothetical protein
MSKWHVSAIRASDLCMLVWWGSSTNLMPPISAQWGASTASLQGFINMCCSALGRLSWNFNWSNTLERMCKHLPLISLPSASSKLRMGVILVHLHWVLASSGTSDRLSYGFLVTLGGCGHLDGLEKLGVIEEDWWLFFASDRLILWRGTWSCLEKCKRGYSSNLLVARRSACGSDSCNTQDVGLVCDAN